MNQADAYAGLEPSEVWRHFAALNRIPRPSGREAAALDYVKQAAEAAGAAWAADARGSVVVRVPATPGREVAPAVAIQAHLDMVCEKRPGVEHDFTRDPIRPRVVGDLVYATGTTLGADNGIGAACGLAVLTGAAGEHGPVELIFTVEEETGLHGAADLDPALVSARLLINLDSEDPRELTVGCAGGAGMTLTLPVTTEAPPDGLESRSVVVAGLKGGHSGVQIHERLANAIQLLTTALLAARDAGADFSLASVRGGNAHNAIPRDAAAELLLPSSGIPALEGAVERVRASLRAEWGADEPDLSLTVVEAPGPARVLSAADRDRVLGLLDALPHGVQAMSGAFPGKVETSCNLAQVRTHQDAIVIGTSSRSFVPEELDALQARIARTGERAGARVDAREGYPGWEPDPDSGLLHTTERVYREVFGTAPEVQVIHAGLECGVIVSKLPGMEAISFGPRIEGAHTPEERVAISTVASTWRLLTALLAAIAREPVS